MSLGMTLQTYDLPSLFTDCLVQNEDFSLVPPSKIAQPFPDEKAKYARLVSKFIAVDRRTVLTLAGDEARIIGFLDSLGDLVPRARSARDPIQVIADTLNNYDFGIEPRRGLEMLGFSVSPGLLQNDVHIHWRHPYGQERGTPSLLQTRKYGACCMVGSGRQRMTEIVKHCDDQGEAHQPFNRFMDSASLVGAANHLKLYDYKGLGVSWGGYIQWSAYYPEIDNFRPHPTWLHLNYTVRNSSKGYEFGLDRRVYVYSAVGHEAYLVAFNLGGHGVALPIRSAAHCQTDFLFPDPRSVKPVLWTIGLEWGDETAVVIPYTFSSQEVFGGVFNWDGKNVKAHVPNSFLEGLLRYVNASQRSRIPSV